MLTGEARGLPDGAVPFHDSAVGAMDGATAARVITAAADVAVVIDADGIVRDLAYGNAAMASAGLGNWSARRWIDTVTVESRGKIVDLLRADRSARWRQVNHLGERGEVPVRYLALDLGGDRTLAIGRDLREQAALQQRLLGAQQAMERDYLRLRQTEVRYRALFDLSDEAVYVVETTRRRIIEANPAALKLAGEPELVGQSFAALVHEESREAVIALLGAVAAAEQAGPTLVRMTSGEGEFALSATLFRQDRAAFFLIRVAAAGAAADPSDPERLLLTVVERVPEAFVVTDDALTILAENAAFLDLTGFARVSDVRGEPLSRFVGRPGIDLSVMVGQLREHGTLRNFVTVVRGRDEAQEEVEVNAVAVVDGPRPCLGFSIRGVARRSVERAAVPVDLPRSVEQLTELVGRVSLKEIVLESSDLIERLCIEAALNYTGDNRASAAEILGLSRQSLYSKLHRHGLGNLAVEPN